MKMKKFDSKVKNVTILMCLGAAIPIIALICLYILGHKVSLDIYLASGIVSVGWISLFFLCLKNLKYGILIGIVWGLVNIIGPLRMMVVGSTTPLAEALGLPICPFAIASAVIGLVIACLCYSFYRKLRKF